MKKCFIFRMLLAFIIFMKVVYAFPTEDAEVYYTFDKTNYLKDISGNRNDGTAIGSPTIINGLNGTSSALFDKANTAIKVPSAICNGSSEISISFWAKSTSSSLQRSLLSDGTWNSYDSVAWHYATETSGTGQTFGLDGTWCNHLEGNPTENVWHHYVLRYNGSRMEVLEDNKSLISCAKSGYLSLEGPIYIGSPFASSFGSPAVTFDEFALWCRDISDSEVKQLFDLEKQACPIPSSGTVTSNLDIHMPSLNYETLFGTQNIWADLEYLGTNSQGQHIWGLKDFGVNE